MTDRDTDRRPPAVGEGACFLDRWSQRKRAVAAGAPLPEPVAAVPPTPVEEAATDAPLADPALLDFSDDFKPYLRAKVAPALKKAALKKLFSDPSFNEIDGLDVYLEDYNLVPDLPAADLALLDHAKEVLWPDRRDAVDGEDVATDADALPQALAVARGSDGGVEGGVAGHTPDEHHVPDDVVSNAKGESRDA